MAQETDAEAARGRAPPYIAFQSLKTLMDELKKHVIPNRIDRSVLTRFSGAVGSQLLGSLKFLRLINDDAVPTAWLHEMVAAYETEEWPKRLRQLLLDNYRPILAINLETATPAQFNEAFRATFPVKEDVLRKCITFFLNAVREAEIAISPRILKNTKPRASSGRPRRPRKVPDASIVAESRSKPGDGSDHAGSGEGAGTADEFKKELLNKFPAFDPTWPDNIKAEWFKGFDQFMGMAKK